MDHCYNRSPVDSFTYSMNDFIKLELLIIHFIPKYNVIRYIISYPKILGSEGFWDLVFFIFEYGSTSTIFMGILIKLIVKKLLNLKHFSLLLLEFHNYANFLIILS